MEFAVGSILADRYRLESLLGQGGMGSVWRAQHLTLNSPVAVKLIDPRIASTPMGHERFVREARAAATLRSPHVVQTLDYGVHEGVPFIAMELMEGESLADRLHRVQRLSPAEAAHVLTHMGRAVGKAHDAGIIHRDLKPDNVFLVHNDDEEIAKVLDFGIAKMTHESLSTESSRTETGVVVGTPFYMSPEQAGGQRVDARADLWAMGVIAYQCVLGVLPFPGQSLGEVIIKICTGPIPVPSAVAAVPPGFDAWFAKACARDPEQRFQTARQMTDAFRLLITRTERPEPYSAPVSGKSTILVAGPGTEAGVTREPTTRAGGANPSRNLAVLAVVAVVAVVAALVVALTGSKTEPSPPPATASTAATATTPVAATPPPPVQPAPRAPEPVAAPEPTPAPAMTLTAAPAEPAPSAAKPVATSRVVARPARPLAPAAPAAPAKPSKPAPKDNSGPTDFGF